MEIAGIIFTITAYVGGFFPAYFFVKRRLRRNPLVGILAGILGMFIWDFFIFMAVEFSLPLWRNYSTLTLVGGALVTLAPYLSTYIIITRFPPSESL